MDVLSTPSFMTDARRGIIGLPLLTTIFRVTQNKNLKKKKKIIAGLMEAETSLDLPSLLKFSMGVPSGSYLIHVSLAGPLGYQKIGPATFYAKLVAILAIKTSN